MQGEYANERIALLVGDNQKLAEKLDYLLITNERVYEHSVNTTFLVGNILKESRLNEDYVREIVTGALLHDLGKTKIPIDILKKNGRLTDEEFSVVKHHPELGVKELTEFDSEIVKNIVLLHHEKLDGSGYPFGMKDIPDYVQLVSVMDMYDALVSQRCYKKPYIHEKAMDILYEDVNAGKLNNQYVDMLNYFHGFDGFRFKTGA